MIIEVQVDVVGFYFVEVGQFGDDVIDRVVGFVYDVFGVGLWVGEDCCFGKFGDLVGDFDLLEVQVDGKVVQWLVDQVQGNVVCGFWLQVGIVVGGVVELLGVVVVGDVVLVWLVVGVQVWVVVVGVGIGGEGWVVQFVQ